VLLIINMVSNILWGRFFVRKSFVVAWGFDLVMLVSALLMNYATVRHFSSEQPLLEVCREGSCKGIALARLVVRRLVDRVWIGAYSGWLTFCILQMTAITLRYSFNLGAPHVPNGSFLRGVLGKVASAVPSSLELPESAILLTLGTLAAVAAVALWADWAFSAAIAWGLFAVAARAARSHAWTPTVLAPATARSYRGVEIVAFIGGLAALIASCVGLALTVTRGHRPFFCRGSAGNVGTGTRKGKAETSSLLQKEQSLPTIHHGPV